VSPIVFLSLVFDLLLSFEEKRKTYRFMLPVFSSIIHLNNLSLADGEIVENCPLRMVIEMGIYLSHKYVKWA